jgi:hypothetical protein
MKPVWGLFWTKKQRPLKVAAMIAKAGIPLMHQLMDPLCKELPGLLLEPLPHCGLDIFVQPKSTAL